MLEDTLAELIEFYLRYAGCSYAEIDRIIDYNPQELSQCARWLRTLAPELLSDERIEDAPLEWDEWEI